MKVKSDNVHEGSLGGASSRRSFEESTARELVRIHNIDFESAYAMTRALFGESRRALLEMVGPGGAERWKTLSFADKAALATYVVRALLDKRKVTSFLAGDGKKIV